MVENYPTYYSNHLQAIETTCFHIYWYGLYANCAPYLCVYLQQEKSLYSRVVLFLLLFLFVFLSYFPQYFLPFTLPNIILFQIIARAI